jgi:thioredoxin reductase
MTSNHPGIVCLVVVAGGSVDAAQDIIRVRRKAHGAADWIHSPACPYGSPPPGWPAPDQRPARTTRAARSTCPVRRARCPVGEFFSATSRAVWAALSEVIDPDFGVSVVDLGFVRAIAIEERTAVITMTLTSAACPLTDVLENQIRAELARLAAYRHDRQRPRATARHRLYHLAVSSLPSESAEVVIVGGGPAGLTAARHLRAADVSSVLVLEREAEAGGIPRHSDHLGYGLRDLRTVLSGPAYARRLAELADAAGAEIRLSTTVTGWAADRSLLVTSPRGRRRIDARAVVLATGARERPRSARLVPGDRPDGVFTTGQLQNHVHLHHQPAGSSAVIVGAELVSWSAVLTLRAAGCQASLMTTEYGRPEAYAAVTAAGRLGLRVPVARRTRVTRVIGRDRVRAVELEHLDHGKRLTFACDTVVFTGNWIPDHELARLHGIEIDPQHLGPVVDSALRTTADGVFGVGNLLHPVDTADVAALDGRHVVGPVLRYLAQDEPDRPAVRLRAEPPFTWVTPGLIRPGDIPAPRGHASLWAREHRPFPVVTVRQGGRIIARRRLPWPVSPGRVFRVPWDLFGQADPDAGDVTVGLAPPQLLLCLPVAGLAAQRSQHVVAALDEQTAQRGGRLRAGDVVVGGLHRLL